jgi:hypothetical protein
MDMCLTDFTTARKVLKNQRRKCRITRTGHEWSPFVIRSMEDDHSLARRVELV